MPDTAPPLVLVDAANVVGSTPDGWWRDRRAATERLRDRLVEHGIDGVPSSSAVMLVVEGQARGVAGVAGVQVVESPGTADDRIVDLVAEHQSDVVYVVTADRELRDRVTALGARVLGPRAVRR